MITLETPRLILRPFTLEDLDAYHHLGSNAEIFKFRGLGARFQSREEARRVLLEAPLRDYRVHGYGRFACVDKASQRLIGFNGLKYLDDLAEVDLGYRLLPEFWGKGYATEGALEVMRYGRNVLGFTRIIGLVDPANTPSIKVLEKVGMAYEKTITLADVGEVHVYV